MYWAAARLPELDIPGPARERQTQRSKRQSEQKNFYTPVSSQVISLENQQPPRDQETQSSSILSISQIKPAVESYARLVGAVRCGPRQKQRHFPSISLKTFTEELSQRCGFDAHYRQIDAKKERGKEDSEPPSAGPYRESETENKAAQVKWISGIGVRASSCQRIVLSKMTGTPGT